VRAVASRVLRQRSGWLVQNGRRVLFIRTTDLVQRLLMARRDLELEAAIAKLDKYQLLILTISPTSPRIRPRPVCCSG
jgi:DNA replication protein DnaC